MMMGGSSQKKAIREQTKTIKENAAAEEKRSRELAVASQQQQESMIRRQKATEAAQALEDGQVKQTVETDLAPVADDTNTEDDGSGRRINTRDRYLQRVSGLRINV